MELLWPQLRPAVTPEELIAVVLLFGLILGFLIWSDLFRDRFVPDKATLPLLAVAFVLPPIIFENLLSHYIAAAAISLFVLFAWFIGAWADGDLKIFLSYTLLLGLASLPTVVLACFIILLYSLPTMMRSWKNREEGAPRGHRLGTAPGVPGIALALPISFLLWGSAEMGALLLLTMAAGFAFSFLFSYLSKAEEKSAS